ncbi:MAG: exodeoxyribonuclease III [Scytolyngbya sp. HA4215-MV1]|jgi:exodeoxyribonuclease-3|nr:exodeoxyribonuclease III [Scytolyngbya sp. HA4215-MV1]
MTLKIATWNVNSIRTRLSHVTTWLQENPVDVLCLQETKVIDQDFPRSSLEDLGYHLEIFGQKSYNGVAILSRTPLQSVSLGFAPIVGATLAEDFDDQKRVITGIYAGIRIVNLYVPNGSAMGSEKYEYKLRWFKVLYEYLKILQHSPVLPASPSILICGDFNIALEDIDIHDPTGREKQVMATDAERLALRSILDLGFQDAFRKFTLEGGHFSWWDYRAAAFRRNLGWRIDHHYLTPDLYEQAIACTIDKAPRSLEQPSDHTPVIVELEVKL